MDNSGPAFPSSNGITMGEYTSGGYPGVTKRELAAMFAMAGMLASPSYCNEGYKVVSDTSVGHADALLAALKEETK